MTSEDLREFKIEAVQMLDAAERALLSQGQSGDFKQLYSLLFRTFHGLKSASLTLGNKPLCDHLSKIESLLESYKGKVNLSVHEVGFFRKSIEASRNLIEGIAVEFNYDVGQASEFDMLASPIGPASLSTNEKGVVYILDDEPDILEILSSMLESVGLTTMTFTEPLKMLEAFRRQTPDLVLSDMKMPGQTGLDILKSIKSVNSDIPVVFISGYLDAQTLLGSIEAGVHSAIEKPFDMNKVLDTVLGAIRLSQLHKLLSRSINLLLFQFSDLKDFLHSQGKADLANAIQDELHCLIDQRRKFREIKKAG